MKTMLRVALAVASIGIITPAFADSEGGAVANSYFTSIPEVVAQAPAQNVPAVAATQNGQSVQVYATIIVPTKAPGCLPRMRAATANLFHRLTREGAGTPAGLFRFGDLSSTGPASSPGPFLMMSRSLNGGWSGVVWRVLSGSRGDHAGGFHSR
jgi:hypothetical protein